MACHVSKLLIPRKYQGCFLRATFSIILVLANDLLHAGNMLSGAAYLSPHSIHLDRVGAASKGPALSKALTGDAVFTGRDNDGHKDSEVLFGEYNTSKTICSPSLQNYREQKCLLPPRTALQKSLPFVQNVLILPFSPLIRSLPIHQHDRIQITSPNRNAKLLGWFLLLTFTTMPSKTGITLSAGSGEVHFEQEEPAGVAHAALVPPSQPAAGA